MATIRDRKEKLATVEENNNFSDSPRAPPPLPPCCMYISRDCSEAERNSAMNYSRGISRPRKHRSSIFFSLSFARNVKLKNRTTSQNASRSSKFSRIQACTASGRNCSNTREEYWNLKQLARDITALCMHIPFALVPLGVSLRAIPAAVIS